MTDSNTDDVDPTARDQREIGREMVEQSTGLGSVMAHAYRGELDQATTWRQRLDQATTWAVTVIAAILTWAFSSGDNPIIFFWSGSWSSVSFSGSKRVDIGITTSTGRAFGCSSRISWRTRWTHPGVSNIRTGE